VPDRRRHVDGEGPAAGGLTLASLAKERRKS
jgi:hypothetical protein